VNGQRKAFTLSALGSALCESLSASNFSAQPCDKVAIEWLIFARLETGLEPCLPVTFAQMARHQNLSRFLLSVVYSFWEKKC
jgi:hypothetical protein